MGILHKRRVTIPDRTGGWVKPSDWNDGHDIEVTWDDLTFPVATINPAGSASPASFDQTVYPGTLLFASNVDNHLAYVAQMPHRWKEGTEVRPHIHWSKTTADPSDLSVGWQLRHAICPVGEVLGAYSDWENCTLAIGDLTTKEMFNISRFPDIDMTGQKVSCHIVWELRRNVGLDTYGQNARLVSVDFHFQIDAFGSSQEYVK